MGRVMKQYDFRTAYIDLLLNLLTTILAMFIVAMMAVNVAKKDQPGIKKDAQLVMNVTWDDFTDCDVDIWAEDPAGNIVSFQNKSIGLMHIERDDLGFRGDMTEQLTGDVDPEQKNTETWVLRGKMAGPYTLNIHLYACRIEGVQLGVAEKTSIPVTVELIKLNPDYSVVKKEIVTFTEVWEEKNLFVFDMDQAGKVSNFRNTERTLVKSAG